MRGSASPGHPREREYQSPLVLNLPAGFDLFGAAAFSLLGRQPVILS
jgi:hypothetical protein